MSLLIDFPPYMIENGGGFPSHLKDDDQKLVADTAIKSWIGYGNN